MMEILRSLLEEHDGWLGGYAELSHYQGWLIDAALLLIINVTLWIFSLIVGKCWPVDFIWSNWPILMTANILYRSPLKFVSPKQWLILGVVSFWGLRLTINFLSRGGLGHEDWRYTEMREYIGPKWFPLCSLPMVFLGQSTFLYLACLPLYGALRNGFSVTRAQDLQGLTLCLLAVVIETAADEQMDGFIARKKQGLETQAINDKGIWAWSRHPNYFGEVLFWVGLWLLAGGEIGPALAGPVLMQILMLGISIPLMEDRQIETKGETYIEYQRKVPSKFFLLPPFLQRIICRRRIPSIETTTPMPKTEEKVPVKEVIVEEKPISKKKKSKN